MFYALAVGSAITITQVFLFWRLTREVRDAARLGARITALSEALTLLTETTESGFAAIATELNRREPARRSPRSRTKESRRPSEGERHLRLTLAAEEAVR